MSKDLEEFEKDLIGQTITIYDIKSNKNIKDKVKDVVMMEEKAAYTVEFVKKGSYQISIMQMIQILRAYTQYGRN